MEHNVKDKIEWTVIFLAEFGKRHRLTLKQSFNYLLRYKGINFVEQHYDYLHTQSFVSAVDDLTQYCHKLGGGIAWNYITGPILYSTKLTYGNQNRTIFDDYSENWAEFILANRNNSACTPIHNYDIVIGPIANDRVGVQLWKYENQLIDMPTLVGKLKYMKGLTIQYFFGTETALSILKRVKWWWMRDNWWKTAWLRNSPYCS